ncbi:MAG: DNA polymerase/3'-5' exonuclease PolX [Verrucomicrobia bacterium]|nr:DNA polymerase/3'-5' exonuclease PolX [Verrucomicrobiota bacterium]
MNADEISTILENIARLLALKGENPFKTRAYLNGARAIEMFAGSLREAAEKNQLGQVEGIGKALAEKISELILTGKMEYYERLREEFPAGILELFELPGLGEKKIKVLHEQLKITGIPKLEEACRDGRIAALPGFGEKTALKLLAAIETRRSTADLFTFGSIASDARAVHQALRDHPAVGQVSPAGSYRRRKEIVHDLDFVASTREPEAVGEYFASLPEVTGIIAQGKTKVSVRLRSGVPCDLRLVSDAEFPFALQYFTGSKEHNVALRQRAMARGWTLNEYRIAPTREDADPIPPMQEEREVYRALGLDYIEPELRENHGELEAAEAHTLPELVQLEHLRGTFHNHTTASDGRDSLRAMAEAAQELGLQYLGIADHSKSSVIANGLNEQRLEAQLKEIDALNAEYRGQFRIFAGTECDIHKDGTLDFDDSLLAQLDYVVASVHVNFTLSEAEQTARIVRALENPHVTMLGHVTGRLLLQRSAYEVNIPAIIDAAARTGTIIELNANPRRLDLDWRWWKNARDKGVLCSINPDAHRTEALQDLWFGVGAARKGWLRREDVLNCLPLNQVIRALAKKRKAAQA